MIYNITVNFSFRDYPKFIWQKNFLLIIESSFFRGSILPFVYKLGWGYIWDSCPFAGWMRTPPSLLDAWAGCSPMLPAEPGESLDTPANTVREEPTAVCLWLSIALLLAFPFISLCQPCCLPPSRTPSIPLYILKAKSSPDSWSQVLWFSVLKKLRWARWW